MGPVVQITNLDFAYRDQLVLKQINLPLEANTTLGVIGPNGGGKTTLLRLLLAQHLPTRGEISVAGLTPRQAIGRGDVIGYLPQNFSAPSRFPLSVRQLITLGLAGKTGPLRRYTRDDLQFVDWLIDHFHLRDLAERPVFTLSGGQRQLAFIARALAPRPKLLLLDEPTTGIDRSAQQRFIHFLQDLRRQLELTIVLISHDLPTVSALSHRIACLNVTLHYHDTPEKLPEDFLHHFLGCAAQVAAPAVT